MQAFSCTDSTCRGVQHATVPAVGFVGVGLQLGPRLGDLNVVQALICGCLADRLCWLWDLVVHFRGGDAVKIGQSTLLIARYV